MSEKEKDNIVLKLTKMLIEQDLKDKKKGKTTYVKKTRIYQDLIKLFKEML